MKSENLAGSGKNTDLGLFQQNLCASICVGVSLLSERPAYLYDGSKKAAAFPSSDDTWRFLPISFFPQKVSRLHETTTSIYHE